MSAPLSICRKGSSNYMPTFYQPDPNSKTIVDAAGKPISFSEYKAQGGVATSPNMKFPDVVSGSPTTPGTETPAGNLSTLGGDTSRSSLGNLQTALRDALNEAGKRRMTADLGAIAPLAEGATPGSMGQIVALIRNSVSTPIESVFKDILDQKAEEQKIAQQNRQNALDIVKAMASDGSLGGLPDEAILAISKTTGLDAGQLLQWRTNVKTKDDLLIQKTQADIAYERSQTAKNNASTVGTTSPGFSDDKVESDVRSDAASLLDNVQAGSMSLDDAYKRLRLLYSPKEATDDALKGLLGLPTSTGSTFVPENPPIRLEQTQIQTEGKKTTNDNNLDLPYTYQSPDINGWINNLSKSLFNQ